MICRGPYGELIGTVADEVEEDRVVVRLPQRPQLMNGAGIVHGGATATLVDTAATAAAWATGRAGPDTRGTTVGFAISYLAPGRAGDLLAEARVVQRGGSLTIIDVMVRDEAGSPVAKAQVTYKIGLGRTG
ncbi:MAG TPA: PaaI family thioesterase [Alphaproteobacteria bacterium]|nr:PaaI family thioesterase [Alphaproteobacteria bacterium]